MCIIYTMSENKTDISVERDVQGYVKSASLIEFESSNFKRIQYRVDGGATVDITYKNGAVYRYYGIPPALWDHVIRQAKKQDTSIGKQLHNELVQKKDIYPYRKIT